MPIRILGEPIKKEDPYVTASFGRKMLCACSGEQFKLEAQIPQSPESLATRDFSASGLSSRIGTGTGDLESKFEDAQVDEAESTLKEALSLNYEEARALLGRLEYQRGNFDAALQVFQGIDIKTLSPRMSRAFSERIWPQKSPSRGESILNGVMSLHSASLLVEAILLKAKSLMELGRVKEAAKECKIILDIVESALPNGMPRGTAEDCKLQETFHKALELLPNLWIQAGLLDEAITAYRRALVKPWGFDPQRLARVQKDLAVTLLYGSVEASIPPHLKVLGPTNPANNTEEAILLFFILMKKVLHGEIAWDAEIIEHLSFALAICGQFEYLANHVEQALPGAYNRAERWFILALCYSAAGQDDTALNLIRKASDCSESKHEVHIPSFLLGAKLCSQNLKHAHEGISFSRRIINFVGQRNEHFKAEAYKFLGVCYGNAAQSSFSDSERVFLNRESLNSLNHAAQHGKNDPEVLFSLGVENARQRNLAAAFSSAMLYSDVMAGSSGRGWKLLTEIVAAEQRFQDAETIVDLAIDETTRIDQLELIRLKASLQIAQEQPKQAIETYRILLSLIQAQRELDSNVNSEVSFVKRLETEAWLDLAKIYSELESQRDAKTCLDKAKSIEFYSPLVWHSTGMLFKSQSMYNDALVAFLISLSIEPNYIASIVSTAEVLMKMGNQSLPIAKSFLMNALQLEPTNHNAWLNLGLVSKMEGSMQQAADFFQAAHELKLSAPVQSFV